YASGARAPREAPPGRTPAAGGNPRLPHLPMCRPREGDDRGRWLIFLPAEPLELVARPHLRRPAALRVRRPCVSAEGLAARAAHGRRFDVRGVRRDPGRTASLPVRIHEGTTGGAAAGHGE